MMPANRIVSIPDAHRPAEGGHQPPAAPPVPAKIRVRNLNFFYGAHRALIDNNIDIYPNTVTAFIGPSGCGKSTHLRAYNRIFELYPGHRARGEILLDNNNLL